MRIENKLIAAAAFALGAMALGASPASAQAAGASNGLDHTFRSLEAFRDEVRAQAGWRKERWQCQPTGPCVWVPGYWGPPPPSAAPGVYVYVRPFDGPGY